MKKTNLLPLLMLCLMGCNAAAEQKPPLQARSASLQCGERKVEVQAQCYKEDGIPGLSCTSQKLTVSGEGVAAGKATHVYKPQPLQTGDAYPAVEEKIGALVCTATPDHQKYIVAMVSNGGNCAKCEWAEVYGWDGALIGTTRDARTNKVVSAAAAAAFDKKNKQLATGDAGSLYSESKRRGN